MNKKIKKIVEDCKEKCDYFIIIQSENTTPIRVSQAVSKQIDIAMDKILEYYEKKNKKSFGGDTGIDADFK